MTTHILSGAAGRRTAAALLKDGAVVALPTETVYGLAANALDPEAVAAVFNSKKRPLDNPLIVHVAGKEAPKKYGLKMTPLARRLIREFWPGPLTILFQKVRDAVPSVLSIPPVVSCGLDTVAVRFPNNETFVKVIKKCGFPLVAPSANLAGRPSPTTAAHVYKDLKRRIPLIVDGGACEVGLESTVVKLERDFIRILRPGAITAEMLSEFGKVIVDDAVYNPVEGVTLSPGTAYKHYSPKAEVVAVRCDCEKEFCAYIDNKTIDTNEGVIVSPEMHTLYSAFRDFDDRGAVRVYVRLPEPVGVGLALYNRIVRAAEFNVIEVK